MSGCHSNNNGQMHSPLKTMLRKIRNRYQTYCTVYKMQTMATCHGGAGHPVARDVNLHTGDPEAIGIDNDNDSISGSDATVALGGLETEGNTNELLPSNQAKLTPLTWEINELCQWVEAREGQPAESLDCIEQELQNLSLALQPPPSPTPTEPLREVIHYYMDTLCTTQMQTNLTNSLLQDIAVFNEHDSTNIRRFAKGYRNSSRSNY